MRFRFALFVFSAFLIWACSEKPEKVKIVEITLNESPEARRFIGFWKDFSGKFNASDTTLVRKFILDSVWLWNREISANDFMRWYKRKYSASGFLGILDTNKAIFRSVGCVPSPPVAGAIRHETPKLMSCREVLIVQDTAGPIVSGIEFTFLETTKGYRLLSVGRGHEYWRPPDAILDTVAVSQE